MDKQAALAAVEQFKSDSIVARHTGDKPFTQGDMDWLLIAFEKLLVNLIEAMDD